MRKNQGVFPVTHFLKNRIHQRAFPRVFHLPLGQALATENDLVLSAYMPQISQHCIPITQHLSYSLSSWHSLPPTLWTLKVKQGKVCPPEQS